MPIWFRPWPQYLALGAVFCLLKLTHQHATVAELRWLLGPTSALVEVATGTGATFVPAVGHRNPALGIVLVGSCSGFNFWLLTTTLLAGVALRQADRVRGRWLAAALGAGYSLTLLANTARILTAVQLGATLPPRLLGYGWLHQAEGALVYIVFLLGGYVAFTAWCRPRAAASSLDSFTSAPSVNGRPA